MALGVITTNAHLLSVSIVVHESQLSSSNKFSITQLSTKHWTLYFISLLVHLEYTIESGDPDYPIPVEIVKLFCMKPLNHVSWLILYVHAPCLLSRHAQSYKLRTFAMCTTLQCPRLSNLLIV